MYSVGGQASSTSPSPGLQGNGARRAEHHAGGRRLLLVRAGGRSPWRRNGSVEEERSGAGGAPTRPPCWASSTHQRRNAGLGRGDGVVTHILGRAPTRLARGTSRAVLGWLPAPSSARSSRNGGGGLARSGACNCSSASASGGLSHLSTLGYPAGRFPQQRQQPPRMLHRRRRAFQTAGVAVRGVLLARLKRMPMKTRRRAVCASSCRRGPARLVPPAAEALVHRAGAAGLAGALVFAASSR